MRNKFLLLALFFFVFIPACNASAADYDEFMASGKSELAAGDYAAAEASFRGALALKPDDHEATLYLGMAGRKAGKKAAASDLKNALQLNPEDPQTNLELGIYYFDIEVYPEAKDFFETALALGPDTPAGKRAQDYLDALLAKEEEKKKRWAVNLSAGVQYDSNVILNGEDSPLPDGISGKSDYRWVGDLSASYIILKTKRAQASLAYYGYKSLHNDLSDYDVFANSFGIGASYDPEPFMRLKLAYTYEYNLLNSDEYDTEHTVAPSILISARKGFVTAIDYRTSSVDYEDSDSFPTNSFRSGTINALGFSQTVPISKAKAMLGYAFDKADAKKEYYEYKGDKGIAGLSVPFPFGAALDLHAEYHVKDYEGENPISGGDRTDKTATFSGTLKRDNIYKWFGISLSGLYSNNDSNISDYDYKRTVSGILITARF